jgi:nucleotide-binding universal stress UspA family protein
LKQQHLERADLIAMGTHGLGGFRKLLLGSTTERVLRRTDTAVLAVPLATVPSVILDSSGPRLELRRILMGTDFSEGSAAALQCATDLAQQLRVPLVLCHVVSPLVVPAQWQSYVAEVDDERTRYARPRLEALSNRLKSTIECEAVVSTGRPADSIAAIAEKRQAGLIVVGLIGEKGAGAPRPGSTAYRVLCLAHVPVLVVPARSGAQSGQSR